ncbi:MAG: hypothetical protein H7145_18735 [Akkermansiaceae bacterium]|nr:hypothetical protein [Armatimonadota bacterium]
MPELSDDLPEIEAVLLALNAAGVRYVVIGGVAMRLQGASHRTDDFDVFYGRDAANLEAIVRALMPYHPQLRGAPEGLPFIFDARTLKNGLNFTFTTDIGAIDLLGDTGGMDFAGLWERASQIEVNDIPIRVASVDDIIAMKRAANRPKDQDHIKSLEALRRLQSSAA